MAVNSETKSSDDGQGTSLYGANNMSIKGNFKTSISNLYELTNKRAIKTEIIWNKYRKRRPYYSILHLIFYWCIVVAIPLGVAFTISNFLVLIVLIWAYVQNFTLWLVYVGKLERFEENLNREDSPEP
jgi:hypothetical protein